MTKSVIPMAHHIPRRANTSSQIEPNTAELAPRLAVISYLLDKIKMAGSEDERSKTTVELLKYINKNPKSLLDNPKFCQCILDKIAQLELYIKLRRVKYSCARYNEAIDILKKSVSTNIGHSGIKKEVLTKLNEMNDKLTEYKSWMREDSLLSVLSETRVTIYELNKSADIVN